MTAGDGPCAVDMDVAVAAAGVAAVVAAAVDVEVAGVGVGAGAGDGAGAGTVDVPGWRRAADDARGHDDSVRWWCGRCLDARTSCHWPGLISGGNQLRGTSCMLARRVGQMFPGLVFG